MTSTSVKLLSLRTILKTSNYRLENPDPPQSPSTRSLIFHQSLSDCTQSQNAWYHTADKLPIFQKKLILQGRQGGRTHT